MKKVTIIFKKTDDLITIDIEPYGNPRIMMGDGETKLLSYNTGLKLSREYPNNIFLVDTEKKELTNKVVSLEKEVKDLEIEKRINEAAEEEAKRLAKPMPDNYPEIKKVAFANGYKREDGCAQPALIKFLTGKGYK